MKELKDYENTKTQILCNTKEEYFKLIPLLNQVFSLWNQNHWSFGYNKMHIFMDRDSCRQEGHSDYATISAKEFFKEEQEKEEIIKEEIINNYEIY